VPMIKELSWSLNAESHIALLQQSLALLKRTAVGPVAAASQDSPTLVSQNPTRPADTPKWESVSVMPCGPADTLRGARGGGVTPVAGTLSQVCRSVMSLIQLAYVQKAEAIYTPEWNIPIQGGPAWINSDLYTIEAKPEGQPSTQEMWGPMLQ